MWAIFSLLNTQMAMSRSRRHRQNAPTPGIKDERRESFNAMGNPDPDKPQVDGRFVGFQNVEYDVDFALNPNVGSKR